MTTPPTTISPARAGWLAQLLGGAGFVVLTGLAMWAYLAIWPPEPYEAPLEPFLGYDRAPLLAALSPAAVRAELDEVLAVGDRPLGAPGFYRAEELLRQRYQAAGLKLLEHQVSTPMPQTERSEALLADGTAAPFRVYPLPPNHFQPIATPAEGQRGKLRLVTEELLREGHSFRGCLAVIDTADPAPTGYGLNYSRYAQLGFEGVILTHREGLEKLNWRSLGDMVTITPVNYPRLVAEPGILQHLEQEVTLHVRVRYRHLPSRTLVGVLKAAQPAREALVIPVSYEALSALPDKAPGTLQAVPIAIQLALVKSLPGYRAGLRRDVVFIAFGAKAMSFSNLNGLLGAIGHANDGGTRRVALLERQTRNQVELEHLERVAACFGEPAFLTEPGATATALAALPAATKQRFDEQYQYLLNTIVRDLSEPMLAAKIAFELDDPHNLQSPAFAAYQEHKRTYDKAYSAAGYPAAKLIVSKAEFVRDYEVRRRLAERIAGLVEHHRGVALELTQALALNDALRHYRRLVVMAPELMPATTATAAPVAVATSATATVAASIPVTATAVTATVAAAPARESLTFTMGQDIDDTAYAQPAKDALQSAIARLDLRERIDLQHPLGGKHGQMVNTRLGSVPVEARLWSRAAWPAYSIVNLGRSYEHWANPFDLPWMRQMETLEASLQVTGEALLSVAHGNGTFRPMRKGYGYPDFHGRVLVSGVGQSIIPNYPLAGAVLGDRGTSPANWKPTHGYYPGLLLMTDPYGRYELTQCIADLAQSMWSFNVDAVGYDAQGRIELVKDDGAAAQNLFKSRNLRADILTQAVNVVTFRATPVTVFDLINPQTMKAYSAVELLTAKGLAGFPNTYQVRLNENMVTTFVKPDERFFVVLKAGSPENPLVQTTRAFCLGVDDALLAALEAGKLPPVRPGQEINGPGYLAAATPFIHDVAAETARSLIYVNAQRLAVQRRYGMADERTIAFQQQSEVTRDEAATPAQPQRQALLLDRKAVTYAILNHPVLRRNLSEAVWCVLFYLALLVPFVFFFEKLVCGFTDIRRQLTAHVIIFLAVFFLLRWLHPAFDMIRSSLMILLGVIILLIASGIIFLFSSKFRENLEEIKKRRGQVSAAEINTFGAVAVAFMLGLNNMHRRRVRTLLTCSTLVLITFVMICFTSVHSELVERAQAIGRAPYQGFLIKNEQYRSVSGDEVFALQTKYGDQFKVTARTFYMGEEMWDTRIRHYPTLELAHSDGEHSYTATPCSILQFDAAEPLAKRLPLKGRWFTDEEQKAAGTAAIIPVLLPEPMARRLHLDLDQIAREGAPVKVGTKTWQVIATFAPADFEKLVDLDGHNLLPFDLVALRDINKVGEEIIAEPDDAKLSAEQIILVPRRDLGVPIPHGFARVSSVAVVLPETLPYRETKELIDEYMEQSGRSTFYGLDGYSFEGKRARERSFTGMLDMLIPLIIAAMTVLNTLRGSVYERREEIFVYNAVGIAPKHVFFMFFAEALVYSVVGSVLGYLLSQGTGKLLTALELTGGLQMTFTSLNTVYASLAIIVTVLLSSFLPAQTAKRIAAPSDDAGWRLPKPDENALRFKLPFTFGHQDRIGVLAFFHRFFVDHGEGSSGAFFAARPELGTREEEGRLVPCLTVTVWLKPFDLGVSQRLEIALPTDPETGEFIADLSLTRISGTLDNWQRLNTDFVALLRRHFLHWRAVAPGERLGMFEEARQLLTTAPAATPSGTPAHG